MNPLQQELDAIDARIAAARGDEKAALERQLSQRRAHLAERLAAAPESSPPPEKPRKR